MKKTRVILVSGMSGAGKTQAMAAFENLEYNCIDNYPVALLNEFTEYLKEDTPYERVAMAVTLMDAMEAIRMLSNVDWIDLKILLLDCEDAALVKRYKQTRRSHPMMIYNDASTLTEAIQYERRMFDQLKGAENEIIDTTLIKPAALQKRLAAAFAVDKRTSFRISFVSFGFKHGIPKDADLVLDVRFLPNPFYVEELRPLTGNDPEVYNYVIEKPETHEYLARSLPYYDYLLRQYKLEGKMQVTIAIGCTGGQHRSVTLTNYFYQHYSRYYQCYKWHRDADH